MMISLHHARLKSHKRISRHSFELSLFEGAGGSDESSPSFHPQFQHRGKVTITTCHPARCRYVCGCLYYLHSDNNPSHRDRSLLSRHSHTDAPVHPSAHPGRFGRRQRSPPAHSRSGQCIELQPVCLLVIAPLLMIKHRSH